MTDVGSRLRNASRLVAPPEHAFERLQRLRDRRARNRRVTSMVLTLSVSGVVLGSLFAALAGLGSGTSDRVRFRGAEQPLDPRLVLDEGEYFYERTLLVIPDGFEGLEGGTAEIETWWALDGSGRSLLTSDTDAYPPRESSAWAAGEGEFDDTVADLATDPATLEEQLLERSSADGASPQPEVTPGVEMTEQSGRLWRAVEALTQMPNAIPELRVALFYVASEIDGVEIVRNARDLGGRRAIALRIEAPQGGAVELFFDPGTLQPLGTDEGFEDRIVVEAGIVRSRNETPTADERFFPPPTDSG